MNFHKLMMMIRSALFDQLTISHERITVKLTLLLYYTYTININIKTLHIESQYYGTMLPIARVTSHWRGKQYLIINHSEMSDKEKVKGRLSQIDVE